MDNSTLTIPLRLIISGGSNEIRLYIPSGEYYIITEQILKENRTLRCILEQLNLTTIAPITNNIVRMLSNAKNDK